MSGLEQIACEGVNNDICTEKYTTYCNTNCIHVGTMWVYK